LLGFVGAGNMAEAICRGAISGGVVEAGSVIACDVMPQRLLIFEALGARKTESVREVAERSETIILAVKPQNAADVLGELAGLVSPPKLLVSICAGVTTATIEAALGEGAPVVRVMPNTPLLVGKGMSALAAGRWATPGDLERAEAVFSAVGDAVVLDEADIDAVTAVSGSGPAYVFYLVEAMTEAGVAEGLDRKVAERLARRTAEGAGELLAASQEPAEELRRRVTSPGGTTQAAVELMEQDGVKESLVRAVRRAAERSRELGRGG